MAPLALASAESGSALQLAGTNLALVITVAVIAVVALVMGVVFRRQVLAADPGRLGGVHGRLRRSGGALHGRGDDRGAARRRLRRRGADGHRHRHDALPRPALTGGRGGGPAVPRSERTPGSLRARMR